MNNTKVNYTRKMNVGSVTTPVYKLDGHTKPSSTIGDLCFGRISFTFIKSMYSKTANTGSMWCRTIWKTKNLYMSVFNMNEY